MNKTTIEKVHAQRREKKNRQRKIVDYSDKIALLETLMKMHEARGDANSVTQIAARIRTLKQQIRYMGGDLGGDDS